MFGVCYLKRGSFERACCCSALRYLLYFVCFFLRFFLFDEKVWGIFPCFVDQSL